MLNQRSGTSSPRPKTSLRHVTVCALLVALSSAGNASAQNEARHVQIPFIPGSTFELSWKRDFGIDRADIIGCTPTNELARWHEVCPRIHADGQQVISLQFGDTSDNTEAVQGFERPRVSISLDTASGEILADFVPMSVIRSPLDELESSAKTQIISQRDGSLECKTSSTKIAEETFSLSWTLRKDDSRFSYTIDADTLPVTALVGYDSVECSRRLFDGILFRKLVAQERVMAFSLPETAAIAPVKHDENKIDERPTAVVGADFSASEWALSCRTATPADHSTRVRWTHSDGQTEQSESGSFIAPESAFGKPISCQSDAGVSKPQLLNETFLHLAAPSIVSFPQKTESLSIPLELFVPRYAKGLSWECASDTKALGCKVETSENPRRPHLVITSSAQLQAKQFLTLSASLQISGRRFSQTKSILVSNNAISDTASLGTVALKVSSVSPDLLECVIPPRKIPLTQVMWFQEKNELSEFRGLRQIPYTNERKAPALFSCVVLLAEGTKLETGTGQIEINPRPPRFDNLPEGLILGQDSLSMNLSFKAFSQKNISADCSIIDAQGKVWHTGLCKIPSRSGHSVMIAVPTSVAQDVVKRFSEEEEARYSFKPSLFFLIELSDRGVTYETKMPLHVAVAHHRPEIIASATYREKESSICIFIIQDPDFEHLTASVRWLEDPDRMEQFSTFPREGFSRLLPLSGSDFPGTQLGRVFGKSSLRTFATAPSCSVTVSDGTLFAANRAIQQPNEEETRKFLREAVGRAHELQLPQWRKRSVERASQTKSSVEVQKKTPLSHLMLGPIGFGENQSYESFIGHILGNSEPVSNMLDSNCQKWMEALRSGLWPSTLDLVVNDSPDGEPQGGAKTPSLAPRPWQLSVCSLRQSGLTE